MKGIRTVLVAGVLLLWGVTLAFGICVGCGQDKKREHVCFFCGAVILDGGNACRTGTYGGDNPACPQTCFTIGDCTGRPSWISNPSGPVAMYMALIGGTASTTSVDSDGNELAFPYTPRPWSELTVKYAEVVLASELDARNGRITDGQLLLAVGLKVDPEMPTNRTIEIWDSGKSKLLFRGSIEPGLRLALPIPDSGSAIAFEWRPAYLGDAEMQAQQAFFGSVKYEKESKWEMVRP